MEARNRTLPEWLSLVRSRRLTLPRFQRFEAWGYQKVEGLLSTVLRELPAGAVLVLNVDGDEPFVSRPVVGAPADGERIIEHLLDGQQRLTALWRALHDNYEDRSYFVEFVSDEDTGARERVVSFGRWIKQGQRYPLRLNDPEDIWKRNLLPVELLRPDTDAERDLEAWAERASGGDANEARKVEKAANRLRQRFAKFNIPFLSLPSTTTKETALDVFIQMNTSATPLRAYDIVVAQVEAASGASLHDLAEELDAEVPAIGAYMATSDLLLAASALLQDKAALKSTYLSRGFSEGLTDVWPRLRDGARRAFAFLDEERVFDGRRLPTDVVLAPLVALWSEAATGGDAEGEVRTVLRRYLWRASFTDRYERTSATRALVDFRELSRYLRGDGAMPTAFDDEAHPLPTADAFRSAGWPVRTERLPRALLALSLRAGGVDLADGSPARRENLGHREYHHLFPAARLRAQGVSEDQINRALNCALVTWHTNRTISAKEPERYLAERREGTSLGDEEVRSRLRSHLVPYDELVSGDYEAFLSARANLMHGAMRRLCEGHSSS